MNSSGDITRCVVPSRDGVSPSAVICSRFRRQFDAGVATMKNEAKPRVYDILAKAFAQEDVRTCFALLGDANMNWAARLSEQGCRMVYVRHEHCALAAAMAYARKNRDVGVATVTCGPGVTQLITALPAAVRAHLPLVVFAGEAPLKSGWYNQEIDQAPLVTATGAAYHSLHMPERMPVAVRDAFLQARRERRPVVIGVPFDLQGRPWDGPAGLPRPSRELLPRPSPMPPHPDDVAGAAQLLAGRWPPGRVDCCPRRFPREGCSTTILFASASRAASRPRPASNIWRRPTSSSPSAARSPTTRAAAASSGRRRRCCRSISTPSRSVKARRWRVITCELTRAWASRR